MAIEAQGLDSRLWRASAIDLTSLPSCAKGDKIGLVGRNGAGKTTLTRVITGDMLPTSGKVRVSGKLGYLPQDTHAADQEQTALDRMMSARDIASIISRIRKAEKDMTNPDPDIMTKAMNRYDKAMQDFDKAGGYAAQSEAIAMADSLGLPQDVMQRPLGTLSGGQRRRIELARILFSDADTLILDEPTNHTWTPDSTEWLRGFLKKYEAGFLVISTHRAFRRSRHQGIWHLDAQTGRSTCTLAESLLRPARRRRGASSPRTRGRREKSRPVRNRASACTPKPPRPSLLNMMRRVRMARPRPPTPRSRTRSPTSASSKSKPAAALTAPRTSPRYTVQTSFVTLQLAVDKGSRVVILGYNGAGKTTTLRLLAHIEDPDTGVVEYGHGCKIGYFAQEHDTLDLNATVFENLTHVAPELNDTQARSILGSFLFSGDDAFKPARVLSGGEKTRLALATLVTSRANVLLLDEPTNNLDPASRDEILKAIAKYEGAIVLVTHDEGAVQALNPERVLLMPDGDEDLWNDSYLDLVAEE